MTTPAIVPTDTVKPDIVAEIDRAIELVSRAKKGQFVIHWLIGGIWSRGENGGIVSGEDDCAAMCAAVNFLRTHGPDLRRLVENGLRYEWLRECSQFRSDRTIIVVEHFYKEGKFVGAGNIERDALDRAIDTARAQGGGHG